MIPVTDISGQKFNRLTAIRYHGSRNGRARWECLCDCGSKLVVDGKSLRNGNTKSCGCYKLEIITARGRANLRHGDSANGKISLEYISWRAMKARCYVKGNKDFYLYGGRGISVCQRWTEKKRGFQNFLEDMGRRPSSVHTLDRKNSNGNYTPMNCRWATRKEQALTRRPRA
jgi:hypothetical protein